MRQTAVVSSFVKPGVEGLLSPLEAWLHHPRVSEIMINAPGEVFIECEGSMTRHEIPAFTSLYLQRLFQLIANESNQRLDDAHPLLSGSLYNGFRVQLVMPPTSLQYTLAIRKPSTVHLSLDDYASKGFYSAMRAFSLKSPAHEFYEACDHELLRLYHKGLWHEFIQLAVSCRKNIVVSGGTSSGKTTFLNACIGAIPQEERIIVLEDTRELKITHPNQVSLLASKGNQGKACVDMQALLQASLRLRPDRIIMGEIRGREILDFVMACSTGHEGSMTSIHANNPQIAMQRMIGMYKQNNIPSMRDDEIRAELNSVIDIIIQVYKTANGRQGIYCYFKAADEACIPAS